MPRLWYVGYLLSFALSTVLLLSLETSVVEPWYNHLLVLLNPFGFVIIAGYGIPIAIELDERDAQVQVPAR